MEKINEEILAKNYINKIKDGHISFLKSDELTSKAIIQLIESLIETSDLNKKINFGSELWKKLFEQSMSYIDNDKEGYEDLFDYFDEYIKFEELVYATDSFYRDHTLHPIWVYFLTEYIYDSNDYDPILSKNKSENLREVFPNLVKAYLIELNEYLGTKGLSSKAYFNNSISAVNNSLQQMDIDQSVRCVVSLTHDLGYPVKRIETINESIKNIMPYYLGHGQSGTRFSFDVNSGYFNKRFLRMMSNRNELVFFDHKSTIDQRSRVVELMQQGVFQSENEGEGDSVIGFDKLTTEDIDLVKNVWNIRFHSYCDDDLLLKYAADFEGQQHGIMSAYLLVKHLRCFKNIHQKIDYGYSAGSMKTFTGNLARRCKLQILNAIADHTSCGFRISGLNSTSSVLLFIDELEEFSRMSRADQLRQFATEFCNTCIDKITEDEDTVFHVIFEFDNSKLERLDPLRFFKDKCKKFIKILNIKHLDDSLKIRLTCIDVRDKADIKKYSILFKKEYAKITTSGISEDADSELKNTIPSFY